MEVVEYIGDSFDFGICSPRKEWKNEKIDSRKPGSVQHIAFKAESREVVDAIFPKIKALGVKILHDRPMEYKERIAPNYYALFLKAQKAFVLNYFIMPDSLNKKERDMNLLRERVPIQVIFHYGVRMIMRFQRQTFKTCHQEN